MTVYMGRVVSPINGLHGRRTRRGGGRMTVWIVMGHVQYEYDRTVGVYATEELAKEACERLNATDKWEYYDYESFPVLVEVTKA